jgi:hypothetical protein
MLLFGYAITHWAEIHALAAGQMGVLLNRI